ncbi:MAG: SUMF1/EgtB/PvdO family nonheme iron enzyme [Spirochaetales bacterium]|nr:SUMF1/EgtB/PvdO family nonheme iron enzyme [Spirochaetales bacterium]
MKFNRRNKDLPKVDPVKIKPLFGMEPGKWLTMAYALGLVLFVFLVAILPDMIDGHKRVTFTSTSGVVAVYVDDVYKGGTPFTTKIESGRHQVSYRVNGHEIDSFTIKVGHPVFLNWLLPRTQKVSSSASLTSEALASRSKELLEDVDSYSAILEYDDVHRYPPIYTQYAQSCGSAYDADVLKAALQFVTTEEMHQDSEAALSSLGVSMDSPYSQLDGSSTVGVADAEAPTVTAKSTKLKTDVISIDGFTIPAADFSNGREVTASYPAVMEAGELVHTEPFNISAYCITEYQYALFTAANPDWALSNKDNLMASGLVDDYYLDGITLSLTTATNRPIRNISWYAADAFCKWLSSISGVTVYLPSENQWIAASLTDTEGGFQKSLMPSTAEKFPAAMLGSVWEMTGTRFIPLARISDADIEETLNAYNVQTAMVVKGGSYVSDMKSIDRYSVGVASRRLCSDFMGFRIAWN